MNDNNKLLVGAAGFEPAKVEAMLLILISFFILTASLPLVVY